MSNIHLRVIKAFDEAKALAEKRSITLKYTYNDFALVIDEKLIYISDDIFQILGFLQGYNYGVVPLE